MAQKAQKRKSKTHKKQNQNPALLAFINTDRGHRMLVIIVFLIPVLLYLQTVSFGFINFDDNQIISRNEAFLSDLKNTPEAFKTDAFIDGGSHFYRPMQTLSYMGDLQVSSIDDPWMFHLRQVVMLGVIAVVLFLILLRFRIAKILAFWGTVIFSVHPLFVSNIAWVPARGDLQLMLFSLLAFLFFIEFLKRKTWLLLIFSWIAFTMALFSKETAALMPLVFLIYYFVFRKEKTIETKHWLLAGLFLLSGIVWFWMRNNAIGDFASTNEVIGSLSQNGEVGIIPFLLNIQTIPESITNFFFPFDIDVLPGFSIVKTVAGIVIILVLILWIIKNRSRSAGEKLFFLAWFLLLLLPTMLFKPYHIDYLQHRFFLPMAGVMMLVLILIPENWILRSLNSVSGVAAVMILLMSISAYSKSQAYSDPMTFYNTAIDQNDESGFAFIHRGYLQQKKGKANEAISDFTRAIQINSNYAEAYNNRGIIYAAQGQYDKAIADYSKSLELKPENVEAYNNRGLAYSYQGLYKKAIEDYFVVIDMEPGLAEGYNNLGMAYGNQGMYEQAIDGFSRAIELDPGYAMAHNNLGMAYAVQGKTASACQHFRQALKLGLKEAKTNVDRYCR